MTDIHPVQALCRNPRELDVVCTKDGYTFTWKDDGASLTRDRSIPHPFREGFIRKMAQRDKDGAPVYVLKSPVAALYPGDPFAGFPVMNDTIKKLIAKNVEVRTEKARNERLALVQEAEARGASSFVVKIIQDALAKELGKTAAPAKG